MSEKIPLIFNPSAHAEKGKQFAEELRSFSDRIELYETKDHSHLKEIASELVSEGWPKIAVAGGDGTINAVIESILSSEIELGIFPTGTMNLFARELGLPLNKLKECWQVIEKGKKRKVDVFKAGESIFVQVAGVGYDAKIIEETSWENKKKFGRFSYLISAFSVANQAPPAIRVIPESGKIIEGAFVLIGNGALYGPALKLFSEASNDDRLLDVMVFKDQSPTDILRYVSGITLGRAEKTKGIEYVKASRIRVESDIEVPFEVDGELAGVTPIDFFPCDKQLTVFVP
ncbi:MAG: diacylglycerol kinase family lipid kinase [Verrucomicrobiales bacterium]|jgi:YegS/Rv2252/BmrU family lipid kinase|nr:diacylglycerol kinase family lipid kinase [Verrucomicrobiales bacterium]MEC7358318.1 diacylglycerol kinase family protein [Verrucomicrobiota bacterium]|tara:strand:+ start:4076 stop:4939 length:864 start_codon:yes stop_codon:yes gene_type:complete